MARLIEKTQTSDEVAIEDQQQSGPQQWNNPAWHTNVIKQDEFETFIGEEPVKVMYLIMNTGASVSVKQRIGSVWSEAMRISFSGPSTMTWKRIKRYLFGEWKKDLRDRVEKTVDNKTLGVEK